MPLLYRVCLDRAKIEPVEVESYNKSYVFVMVNGRLSREAMICGWREYHETWEAARQALLTAAEARLAAARLALMNAQGFHGNVKGLRNDDPGRGTQETP